ncbi:MAG: isoprenylcysteine carboxylmethyltransferase family protein [Ktedonobacterales bacterium]
MQPLFAQNLPLVGILVASVLLWRVMEAWIDIRSFRRLRAGAQRQDSGSKVVLVCLIALGALLGVLLALKVPAAAIISGQAVLFWLGIALLYVGIALRLYAIHTLGAFFTTAVAIAPEQTVIETGPYRLIRHPSYTGFLLALLGVGLCIFANWLSLLVLMGCALIGIGYRIAVEERVLKERLGQPYQDYMRRTKRLIPLVI